MTEWKGLGQLYKTFQLSIVKLNKKKDNFSALSQYRNVAQKTIQEKEYPVN